MRRAALLILALMIAPRAMAAEAPPPFSTTLLHDHPLVGKVWVPERRAFASPDDLIAAVARADAVLLGETHDNADHHALQAWVVRALARTARKPAVAFEMIDSGQKPALDAHLAAHPGDLAGLGTAIAWDKSGWPDWSLYRPIAEAAGSAPVPANLARADTRALGKGQAPDLAARLGVDQMLPFPEQQAMEAEIQESHCGMLPAAALAPMVTVQRARDAVMAQAMTDGMNAGSRMVLIAGTGHVRADRGVPRRLPIGAKVLSVAFLEVAEGETDPAAYAALYNETRLPFHMVMFTPRAAREDQCEAFRKHMDKKGK